MQKLIIANWKMQLTHQESIEWVKRHTQELNNLAREKDHKIVICPSFTPLEHITRLLSKTDIAWGAQDCAPYERGAYTGGVSVLSLQELGCSYCIIGHNERRLYYKETNKLIAQKAQLLVTHTIEPIICIGETEQEKRKKNTFNILKAQLKEIIEVYKQVKAQKIIIAYEPVWAIGTNKIPDIIELRELVVWLYEYMSSQFDYFLDILVLYGGSVSDKNIQELQKLTEIKGFLLGKASLDFQVLKKIVLSV